MPFVRPAAAALFLQKNFGIIFIEMRKRRAIYAEHSKELENRHRPQGKAGAGLPANQK